ncbi:MAG: Bacterial type II secretion system protein F domain protein [Elusimicrobia bacterium ADurb.Bin231]|nr:MAG: Bacterial type II secretion system protein F domain protein [Elusimicrobia bacterium ADurb.Bin231]
MSFIIAIFVAGCVALAALYFWPKTGVVDLDKRLGKKVVSKRPLTRLSDMLIGLAVKQISKIKSPWLDKQRETVKKRLDMAGNPANTTPDGYIAFSFISGFGFLIMQWMFLHKINLMTICVAGILGYIIPKMSIDDIIKKRHNAIVRTFPDILDLITLSMEAGLDFSAALGKVISKSDPKSPLIEEFTIMQQGMRLGQSRILAMREMVERVQEPNMSTVVTSLIQAEQLGSSLGPVLRVQSEEMRTRRFQLAEKIAQQAPIKMLFPLIFFILPSIFLMLFGPLALQYFSGNLKGF